MVTSWGALVVTVVVVMMEPVGLVVLMVVLMGLLMGLLLELLLVLLLTLLLLAPELGACPAYSAVH
jgi:hypothetical protein